MVCTPSSDGTVVAAQEHIRNLHPSPLFWSSILWELKCFPIRKAFDGCTLFATKHTERIREAVASVLRDTVAATGIPLPGPLPDPENVDEVLP